MKDITLISFSFLSFTLFGQSFKQEAFNSIGIDSVLQIEKQDTLKSVKAKIKGTWQYYGHYVEGRIMDDTLILKVDDKVLLLQTGENIVEYYVKRRK